MEYGLFYGRAHLARNPEFGGQRPGCSAAHVPADCPGAADVFMVTLAMQIFEGAPKTTAACDLCETRRPGAGCIIALLGAAARRPEVGRVAVDDTVILLSCMLLHLARQCTDLYSSIEALVDRGRIRG